MSAVTPEAVDAAAKVLMRGGTVQDMLEAAAPSIVAAALGDDGVPPEALAAACAARYGEPVDTYTWDRVAAAALAAGEPRIRAAERARCANVLAHVPPLGFLTAHGLEPGARTGRVLVAAAVHILAPGGDGAVRTGGGE